MTDGTVRARTRSADRQPLLCRVHNTPDPSLQTGDISVSDEFGLFGSCERCLDPALHDPRKPEAAVKTVGNIQGPAGIAIACALCRSRYSDAKVMGRIKIGSSHDASAKLCDFGLVILQNRPLKRYADSDRGCLDAQRQLAFEDRSDFGTVLCCVRFQPQKRGIQTRCSQGNRRQANLDDAQSGAEGSVGLHVDTNENRLPPLSDAVEQRSAMQCRQHPLRCNEGCATAVDFPPAMTWESAYGSN